MCGKLGDLGVQIPEGSNVSSLIQNHQWNETLIRGIFLPFIVEEIIKIPLSNAGTGDVRLWKLDPKGKYLGRSGYRLGIRVGISNANLSNSKVSQNWWRFLWAMSIPPKNHLFWWRAGHEFISTAFNLRNIMCLSRSGVRFVDSQRILLVMLYSFA